MNWLVDAAQFLVNEFLSVPAFLIGIITAVLGGPFFLYLLLRDRRTSRLA